MKFSPYQTKIAKWLIATTVIALLGFFGIQYPKQQDFPVFPADAVELGITNFDSLSLDSTLNLDETANTQTGSVNFTPAATYYQFAPTAVLTLTLQTGSAAAGDLLILHNTVTTSTVVADTGATVGGGDITLGANDLAIFIYGNSKWIEVASPDNS